MTREEGNKLILLYLGYIEDYIEDYYDHGINGKVKVYRDKLNYARCISETELLNGQGAFHWSFDLLIPVINKIKKSEQFCIISDNDNNWEITIETTGYHYVTHAFQVNESLVEGCWLACVEYIEKFNTGTLVVAKK